MKTRIDWLIRNEDGQGMAEYTLVLALTILAVIGAVDLLGNITNQLYQKSLSDMPF